MAETTKELRERPDDDLRKRAAEIADQLFKLRFQAAIGQNENPGRIRLARRELARVKTLLREREMAAASERGPEAAAAAEPKAAATGSDR